MIKDILMVCAGVVAACPVAWLAAKREFNRLHYSPLPAPTITPKDQERQWNPLGAAIRQEVNGIHTIYPGSAEVVEKLERKPKRPSMTEIRNKAEAIAASEAGS